MEMLVRFLIGGLVVSAFAIIGDMVKPESLGGVFAAAPTIALATVALTIHQKGAAYGAMEGRSMVAGAIAFVVYASAVSWMLMRYRTKAAWTSIAMMALWLGTAAGVWAVWLRR